MMNFKEVYIYLFVIQSTAWLLHLIGCIILLKKRSFISTSDSCQRIFLLHLSVVDQLQAVVSIVSDTLRLLSKYQLLEYFQYVNNGLYITYVLIMAAMLINRFAEIYLSIKYKLFWNVVRTKLLLSSCWLIGISIAITLIIMKFCKVFIPAEYAYLSIIMDSSVLMLSISCNIYILLKITKFKKEQRKLCEQLSKNNAYEITNKSRSNESTTYVLILSLVLTTLAFLVLPDLIANLMSLKVIAKSDGLVYVCLLLYGIGLASDAVSYIIFYQPVKKVVWEAVFLLRTKTCNKVDELSAIFSSNV